jgi:hypothetical protein
MLYPPSTVCQSRCKATDIFIRSYLSKDPPVCLATRKSAIFDQYRFCLSAIFSLILKSQSCLTGSTGVAGQWFSSHLLWNLVCTCSQWCYHCELKIIKPSYTGYTIITSQIVYFHVCRGLYSIIQSFLSFGSKFPNMRKVPGQHSQYSV